MQKVAIPEGVSEGLLNQDLVAINGPDLGPAPEEPRRPVRSFGYSARGPIGRNSRSGLFRTMFLVFRANGAKDWFTQGSIAVAQQSKKHQLHSITSSPKAKLRAVGVKAGLINDICNLAFIGHTNRKLMVTEPATYIGKLLDEQGPATFDAQAIPTDPTLLSLVDYELFLERRRERVAEALNKYLESYSKNMTLSC